MTFPKIAVFLVLGGVLLFGCFAFASNTPKIKTEQTFLFDNQVTFCYSHPLASLARYRQTGFVELDEIETPSLAAMNRVLESYGRAVTPSEKGDPFWVPSGTKKWKRLCKLKLSEAAKPYERRGRSALDANYDFKKANPKPYASPLVNGYHIHERYWFEGDRLVHIELKASPSGS